MTGDGSWELAEQEMGNKSKEKKTNLKNGRKCWNNSYISKESRHPNRTRELFSMRMRQPEVWAWLVEWHHEQEEKRERKRDWGGGERQKERENASSDAGITPILLSNVCCTDSASRYHGCTPTRNDAFIFLSMKFLQK